MKVSILLLASGRGERLAAEVPKAFVRLAGRTLLVHSLDRLAEVAAERDLVVAINPEDRPHLEPLRAELDRAGARVVDGGATRQQSMQRAFAASADDAQVVLVHDAARPFFPIDATRTAIARAAECGAAVLAVPSSDTLKRVAADHTIAETVDRASIWVAQTPQALRRDLLVKALALAERDGFVGTDDVSLFEHAGFPVEVVPSTRTNFKITTQDDLELAMRWAEVSTR